MYRALKKFQAWVDGQDSKRSAALKLSMMEDDLGKYYHGHRRPTPIKRLIIEHVTGIDHLDWLTDEERAAFKSATGKAVG